MGRRPVKGISVPFGGHLQRRRAALVSWVALAVAVGGVVTYAVQADGYQAHEADLNDGGIWVTSKRDGSYGRINKPIGELDGTVFSNVDANLDIVQDGDSVVGINLSDLVVVPLDPAQMKVPDGEEASIPGNPVVGMAGGSLAVLDAAAGRLWATREDPEVGVPSVASLADQSDPLAQVGEDAALAVALDGTVYAASAAEDSLLTVRQEGDTGFAAATTEKLPGDDFSDAIALTAVGAVPVVLDAASGRLAVVGGAEAQVPAGSVLQQPGPSASSVLVGARDGLLTVDLATGEVTTVAGGEDAVGGDPANPVRLGDCVYGAWSGGTGSVVTVCGDDPAAPQALDAQTSDLVFRTNRGQIVLNDRETGRVWDIDSDKPTRLDNWDAFNLKSEDEEDDDDDDRENQGDRRPPKAKNDKLGARPGRTTILHPLDNDTAPSGRLLAIRTVRSADPDAKLAISPDGQTVQITLPGDAAGGTTFEYFIDDGRQSVSAHATVTVPIAGPSQPNAEPRLREGYEPRVWTVPSGGTIDVPVLSDWRDPRDGDPVSTVSAQPVGAGLATTSESRITAAGAVRFQAPAQGGPVQVEYGVSDGLGAPVTETLEFRVQEPDDLEPVAPTAEPDVIAGETGKPIVITPLANDLPGADPLTPDAVLTLAGEVGNLPGADVTTNLVKGTVTLRSETAQTYFLDYQAAYGTADTDTGKIRVDVRAPENPPLEPVAVPDNVTLFGQAGSLVDVLANDVDPSGGLLSVQRAEALADNQLDVAVVAGRWLRLSARQGQLTPNPQIVRYTISNGQRSGISGQVVVSQRPAPADNTPVTQNDDVTVREGSSQAIPVLDNDFSPSGGTLALVAGGGDRSGRLDVQPVGAPGGETGAAFVSGRTVRYVAPTALAGPKRFTIRYQVTNEQGETATGKARVTVLPVRLRTNNPPEPPVVEGRTVSGDTVKLRLPGYGVDPDGDPVTILGLASAPKLGRVTRIGANSIEYTAYPNSGGTDEFSYRITDSLGATSTGIARVSIAPPGPPQPPLAVPDAITVAPGRTAVVDVVANDLVAAGSRVTVSLVDPPAGVRLRSETGPIEVDAPSTVDGRSVEVVYRLTDGLDSSQTTVTLRTQQGYNNPPVVSDAFGAVGDGRSITADVLSAGTAGSGSTSGAYDPDGPFEDLVVADVYAPEGIDTRIVGGQVTVERAEQPMVVPFRVEDADGGAATGSLYVPAADSGLPFVDPGAEIKLKPGQRFQADLDDYVTNPSGGSLAFTLKSRMWASPQTKLDASVTGDGSFSLRAAASYAGPGAVVFEVTTGTSVDDPDGIRAILSVPVQVGETRPILRCPEDPIDVSQAESVRIDIGALCHVWTSDPGQVADILWSADFDEDSDEGLTAGPADGGVVEVSASATATEAGDTGTLRVAADNSNPGRILVRVVRTPPPSLAPIRVSTLKAGESQTIDLARYLSPRVSDPVPTVVVAEQLSNLPVQISSSGSSVTIRTGAKANGEATFRVVMSDVAGSTSPDRQVEGRISLEILGVPDVPGVPVPGQGVPRLRGQPRLAGSAVERLAHRLLRGAGPVRAHPALPWHLLRVHRPRERDDVPVPGPCAQRGRLLRVERPLRGRDARRPHRPGRPDPADRRRRRVPAHRLEAGRDQGRRRGHLRRALGRRPAAGHRVRGEDRRARQPPEVPVPGGAAERPHHRRRPDLRLDAADRDAVHPRTPDAHRPGDRRLVRGGVPDLAGRRRQRPHARALHGLPRRHSAADLHQHHVPVLRQRRAHVRRPRLQLLRDGHQQQRQGRGLRARAGHPVARDGQTGVVGRLDVGAHGQQQPGEGHLRRAPDPRRGVVRPGLRRRREGAAAGRDGQGGSHVRRAQQPGPARGGARGVQRGGRLHAVRGADRCRPGARSSRPTSTASRPPSTSGGSRGRSRSTATAMARPSPSPATRVGRRRSPSRSGSRRSPPSRWSSTTRTPRTSPSRSRTPRPHAGRCRPPTRPPRSRPRRRRSGSAGEPLCSDDPALGRPPCRHGGTARRPDPV